ALEAREEVINEPEQPSIDVNTIEEQQNNYNQAEQTRQQAAELAAKRQRQRQARTQAHKQNKNWDYEGEKWVSATQLRSKNKRRHKHNRSRVVAQTVLAYSRRYKSHSTRHAKQRSQTARPCKRRWTRWRKQQKT